MIKWTYGFFIYCNDKFKNNPFQINISFFYPLKMSENCFLIFTRGREMRHSLIWVKNKDYVSLKQEKPSPIDVP